MEIFIFVRRVLVVFLAVTLYFPLNVPVAALAYKIRNGPKPIPLEPAPFWVRSTFVALGLALLSLAFLVLEYVLATLADFPAGIVHLVLSMLYLPAAVWYVFWVFALDEIAEGLSLFLIYVLLPGALLSALYWLGFELPFDWLQKQLGKPT